MRLCAPFCALLRLCDVRGLLASKLIDPTPPRGRKVLQVTVRLRNARACSAAFAGALLPLLPLLIRPNTIIMSRLLDPGRHRRQKYEFCVVLCVRASTWKDGLLSRFIADDKRMEEGKGRAEEVLKAMQDAGLTIKVKKHSLKDGSRLLMVFVTAELSRLELQHARLQRERWMQEEGIGDMMGNANFAARVGQHPKPSARVVRVGGLHYFAGDSPGLGAADYGVPPTRSAAAGSGSGSGSTSHPAAAAAEEAVPSGFRPSAAHRVELLNHILRTSVEQALAT